MKDIDNYILELNTSFYTYMKRIYGNQYGLQPRIIESTISKLNEIIHSGSNLSEIRSIFISILNSNLRGRKKASKIKEYDRISALWKNEIDVELFLLALYFIHIKNHITENLKSEIVSVEPQGNPLSISYDNLSVTHAYRKRALVLLKSAKICDYFLDIQNERPGILNPVDEDIDKSVSFLIKKAQDAGVEVKTMFGIIMNESVNQSIISSAGGGYEDRIHRLLIDIGIEESCIERFCHDVSGSIEHDFLFTLDGRTYGISAKRTLRERYKQYVNLLGENDIDVLLAITFGTDLTTEKAKTIIKFGVYIFISPEVYTDSPKLQQMDGVFSVEDFNLDTLRSLNEYTGKN